MGLGVGFVFCLFSVLLSVLLFCIDSFFTVAAAVVVLVCGLALLTFGLCIASPLMVRFSNFSIRRAISAPTLAGFSCFFAVGEGSTNLSALFALLVRILSFWFVLLLAAASSLSSFVVPKKESRFLWAVQLFFARFFASLGEVAMTSGAGCAVFTAWTVLGRSLSGECGIGDVHRVLKLISGEIIISGKEICEDDDSIEYRLSCLKSSSGGEAIRSK